MQRAPGLVVVLSLCVIGCGRFEFESRGAPDAPDAPPRSAVLLHLDRVDVQEPLIDFPLLVQLGDQQLDRTRLRSDARDLELTIDGQRLAYEVEDPGTPGGDPVTVWVRVPMMFGRNTTIRLDYGGGEPTAESSGSVWSASYAAVFHLAEAPGASRDATGHYPGPSVMEVGTPGPSPVHGRIGRGRAFESARRNSIQVDARDLLYSPFTVSGWLYETTLPSGFHALVSREHDGAGDNVFWIGDLSGAYRGEVKDQGPVFLESGVAAEANKWVHIALTSTTSLATLFINGAMVQTHGVAGLPDPGNEKPINLGADNNSNASMPDADLLDGRLDEVRIETVTRSAAWLRTDYLSMTDQLIRYEVVSE